VDLDQFPFYEDNGHLEMPGLHVAIRRQDCAAIEHYFKLNDSMGPCDGPEWRPIHMCVLADPGPNRYAILEAVLFQTFWKHAVDWEGRTALDHAVQLYDRKAAAILLRGGLNPNQLHGNRTALTEALEAGHGDMVELLLRHGADPALAAVGMPKR